MFQGYLVLRFVKYALGKKVVSQQYIQCIEAADPSDFHQEFITSARFVDGSPSGKQT